MLKCYSMEPYPRIACSSVFRLNMPCVKHPRLMPIKSKRGRLLSYKFKRRTLELAGV
ncbi:MAG: hypothetical protein JWR38_2213 [Mucilaginibacter sp.]|nr:hypothetical protein [Mucilaginibacter sp.]